MNVDISTNLIKKLLWPIFVPSSATKTVFTDKTVDISTNLIKKLLWPIFVPSSATKTVFTDKTFRCCLI